MNLIQINLVHLDASEQISARLAVAAVVADSHEAAADATCAVTRRTLDPPWTVAEGSSLLSRPPFDSGVYGELGARAAD